MGPATPPTRHSHRMTLELRCRAVQSGGRMDVGHTCRAGAGSMTRCRLALGRASWARLSPWGEWAQGPGPMLRRAAS